MTYQTRAGAAAIAAPAQWPERTGLRFDRERLNLVIFAHPQCPCTRATLAELQVVLTQRGDNLHATLCVFDPAGVAENWADSRLVRFAKTIPELSVTLDRNGTLAGQFGANTSGQVMLFDRQGRRIFSGGITGMRGHEGENAGRSRVLALAGGEVCGGPETPVFGCALHECAERKEAKP